MSSSEHFVGKVTQKALIEREGKVLFCRDLDDVNFDLPGGRIHKGEDPSQALAREVKEELNVDITVGDIFFQCLTDWGGELSPHYFVVFKARITEGQELVPDGVEVGEARWFTLAEVTSSAFNIHQECRKAVEKYFTHLS